MTKRNFTRTQEFIKSMFDNKEETAIINSNGESFCITYQDNINEPIIPIGHFIIKSCNINIGGVA